MLHKWVECKTQRYTELANDNKLEGAQDSLEGREALQRDLNKLEGWTSKKCWILHLGQGKPGCMYRAGCEDLVSTPQKETCGSWILTSWIWVSSVLAARRAKSALGHIRLSMVGHLREVLSHSTPDAVAFEGLCAVLHAERYMRKI